MKTDIIILSGPVHSGKSTALHEWVVFKNLGNSSVHGLLNPEINGQKQFINAHTKEQFDMLASEGEKEVIHVGKYVFSAKGFETARALITTACTEECDYFILDEIGKLELKGEGLESAVSQLLRSLPSLSIKTLVLVVRDFLVDDVIKRYELGDIMVISKEQLHAI